MEKVNWHINGSTVYLVKNVNCLLLDCFVVVTVGGKEREGKKNKDGKVEIEDWTR